MVPLPATVTWKLISLFGLSQGNKFIWMESLKWIEGWIRKGAGWSVSEEKKTMLRQQKSQRACQVSVWEINRSSAVWALLLLLRKVTGMSHCRYKILEINKTHLLIVLPQKQMDFGKESIRGGTGLDRSRQDPTAVSDKTHSSIISHPIGVHIGSISSQDLILFYIYLCFSCGHITQKQTKKKEIK